MMFEFKMSPKIVMHLIIITSCWVQPSFAGTYTPSCLGAVRDLPLNEMAQSMKPVGNSEDDEAQTYNFTEVKKLYKGSTTNTSFSLFRANSILSVGPVYKGNAEMILVIDDDTCNVISTTLVE